MKQLNPLEQHLFDITMAWTDSFWDEGKCLLRATNDPDNKTKTVNNHTVRNTTWYALGLLQQGHDEKAYRAIRSVLSYQYNKPGSTYHGTFKRTPDEAEPATTNEIWKDYDPNWREFICSVFLIMLHDFDLPKNLQVELWLSINIAAEGAYVRNVDAAYSNIALMSAFLLDHAGKHFSNGNWCSRAEDMAQNIFTLFSENNCFWEYNSPTYYGVDLYALALWRDYGLTESFRNLGPIMEAALWQDIASFYHADLKNLCGPYDRSYGMDLNQYVALVAMYIALVVPVEKAPLPNSQLPFDQFDHELDYMFGPLAAYVGTKLPDGVLPKLLQFEGERGLERTIESKHSSNSNSNTSSSTSQRNRTATAFLTDGLMLGGQTPHPSRLPNQQFHVATVHWQLQNGQLCWMRLRCDEHVSIHIEKNVMCLSCKMPRQLIFEVNLGHHARYLNNTMIQSQSWSLPNLNVKHDLPEPVKLNEHSALEFNVPEGEFHFEITLNENTDQSTERITNA